MNLSYLVYMCGTAACDVVFVHVCECMCFVARTIIFGPPGRSRWLIWLFITLMLFWAYPMYFLKVSKSNTV